MKPPLHVPPEGRLLPPDAFTSEELFVSEIERVFHRSWVHVADLSDLRNAGDYVSAQVGTTPVVVVRGEDLQLRGFLNVCIHRGATIAEGSGNCGRTLVCPYHAWSYHTDGRLAGLPERGEFSSDLSGVHLMPVRVATLGPLVFACLDEAAPAFEEWIGSQRTRFDRPGVADMDAVIAYDYDVQADWKLYVENGLEGYHVSVVHDALDDFVQTHGARHYFDAYGSHTHALVKPEFRDTLPSVPEFTSPVGPFVQFGFIFPNLIPVIGPLEMTYLRIDPVAPGRVRLRARSFDGGGREAMSFREFRSDSIDRTNKQDIAVVERVQRGMHVRAYPGGIHGSFLECRIRHFEEVYCREMNR